MGQGMDAVYDVVNAVLDDSPFRPIDSNFGFIATAPVEQAGLYHMLTAILNVHIGVAKLLSQPMDRIMGTVIGYVWCVRHSVPHCVSCVVSLTAFSSKWSGMTPLWPTAS